MNIRHDGPTRDRRSRAQSCHALLLCGLLCSLSAVADERTEAAPQNIGEAALRQVTLAGNGNTAGMAIGLDALPLTDTATDRSLGGPAANDFGASRWGPRRGLTDTSALAPRGPNGASLYAYVDLGSALPARLRELIGQPDGGVTFEIRTTSSSMIGPAMGSMLRWRSGDNAQFGLRLRGGKLRVVYGLRF